MNLLAIDYGRVHLGLAISHGEIPRIYQTVESKSDLHKINTIIDITNREKINKIIIGIGSGKLENHIKGFINKLKKETNVEIDEIDETLTSLEAQDLMIKDNIPRKKRKKLEHAYSALVILNLYLSK